MKKCIILVVAGIVCFASCAGDPEAFLGGVIIAAVCFLFAFRAFKKAQVEKQSIQTALATIAKFEANGLPPVPCNGIALKNDEEAYFAAPAKTYTSKERVTGYTGGSRGVNIHVMKGVNFRVGNHRAKPVRKQVYTYHAGDLVVTNKRVVFVSAEGSFDFPLGKISAVKQTAKNSITIVAGNTSKNLLLTPANAVYVQAVVSELNKTFVS